MARDRGQTYPLCLVCDRLAFGGGDGEEAEEVARTCEREAEVGVEAADGGGATQEYYDYRRGERQRLKVRCRICR